MKNRSFGKLLAYGITALIGCIMVGSVLSLHGYDLAASAADRFRILADAFTIPGVTFMLCWVLVWLSNEGAFEGLSYICKYAIKMLIPGGMKDMERFGDYVERRREKGPLRGTAFLLITGGAFFAVAVVFIALFYGSYGG